MDKGRYPATKIARVSWSKEITDTIEIIAFAQQNLLKNRSGNHKKPYYGFGFKSVPTDNFSVYGSSITQQEQTTEICGVKQETQGVRCANKLREKHTNTMLGFSYVTEGGWESTLEFSYDSAGIPQKEWAPFRDSILAGKNLGKSIAKLGKKGMRQYYGMYGVRKQFNDYVELNTSIITGWDKSGVGRVEILYTPHENFSLKSTVRKNFGSEKSEYKGMNLADTAISLETVLSF